MMKSLIRAVNNTDTLGKRGHAAIEVALMSPWIFLLFIAVFDFGFYAYAAMNIQNAARVAALETSVNNSSAGHQPTACSLAIREMRMLPNIAGIIGTHACTALPLIVTATAFTDTEAKPASRVSVTYQTVPLFPLPFLMGQMTMTRTVEMRVYQN